MKPEKELHILGKVSDESKKLLSIILEDGSDNWFFVSYAPYNFGLKSTFTVDNKLVTLSKVTQQFDVKDDIIPQGWKTICKFEFPDGEPNSFANLKTVNNWTSDDGFRMKVNNSIDAWKNKKDMNGWDSRPEKYRL